MKDSDFIRLDKDEFKKRLKDKPIEIRDMLFYANYYFNRYRELELEFNKKYSKCSYQDYFHNQEIREHNQKRIMYYDKSKRLLHRINKIRHKIWNFT